MKIPTREEFASAIRRARSAGREAADRRHRELWRHAPPGTQLVEEVGGAHLILAADGRTAAGKFLRSLMTEPIEGLSVSHRRGWGYHLYIRDICPYQEISVNEAAKKAAVSVIREVLPVEAHVVTYID
jgi:hypothetical protein